ncbi:hypothetical protein VNO77_13102 [Canavalia gladiata]|uniref:Uncharacterized protein n=1 Tax=Canavalia gladiata TaxID=3824 RepID=A0AAN9QUT7_CANGL
MATRLKNNVSITSWRLLFQRKQKTLGFHNFISFKLIEGGSMDGAIHVVKIPTKQSDIVPTSKTMETFHEKQFWVLP